MLHFLQNSPRVKLYTSCQHTIQL